MHTFVQTETNPALIAHSFVGELWGGRLQPWDSRLYLRRSKWYFNHSYSTTMNQLLPGIGQMFKGLSSWDCSEERCDLKWSSRFKMESWIVKVHISFQMSVLTRKRDLWWKFRILMCILKIISGLISLGLLLIAIVTHKLLDLCAVQDILRFVGSSHCNPLQPTATHCNTLQHTATYCNTLQHTATHCNTLQHTATHCNTPQHTRCRARQVTLRRLNTRCCRHCQHVVTLLPSVFPSAGNVTCLELYTPTWNESAPQCWMLWTLPTCCYTCAACLSVCRAM